MPISGFRREWDKANILPGWLEQKHFFDPRFVQFVGRKIVHRKNT